MKEFLNKTSWYFKQLLPLKYDTTYSEDGNKKLSIWRMWLGRCYDIRDYELVTR